MNTIFDIILKKFLFLSIFLKIQELTYKVTIFQVSKDLVSDFPLILDFLSNI